MNIDAKRLLISGLLNHVPGDHWIAVAETVATLNEEQYETVLHAFRLIRSRNQTPCNTQRKAALPANVIPLHPRRTK